MKTRQQQPPLTQKSESSMGIEERSSGVEDKYQQSQAMDPFQRNLKEASH
jgi:hypothetical protein